MATDDFDRADNANLGADWDPVSGLGSLRITSNQCLVATALTDSAELNNTESWPNDQFSQVTIVTGGPSGAGEGPGPAIRIASGSADFYFVMCNGTNIELWDYDAGSAASIIVDTGGVSAGAEARIEGEGTALRVYEDDVERISTTDSTHSSGSVGLFAIIVSGTANSAMDDWFGGDLDLLNPPPTPMPWLGLMEPDLNKFALLDADLALERIDGLTAVLLQYAKDGFQFFRHTLLKKVLASEVVSALPRLGMDLRSKVVNTLKRSTRAWLTRRPNLRNGWHIKRCRDLWMALESYSPRLITGVCHAH
jgi:hypothetical protein